MGHVATAHDRPLGDLEEISPVEIRAQLERICSSPWFRRSKRLQTFLTYVCELTLKGEADRINEYLLAIEVFDRPSSYSSHEDSTVRRQAHLLREKLDKYYSKEGRDAPLRIDVPVGHYVPVFERQAGRPALDRLASPPGGGRRFSRVQVVVVSLAAASMFFVGRATMRRGPAPSSAVAAIPSPVAAFWEPWLSDPNGAVVCFSTPLTAVIKHYPEPRTSVLLSPSIIVNGQEADLIRATFDLPAGGYIYITPNHSQIKKGEGIGAVLLTRLFVNAGVPLKTTGSLQLSWNDFRNTNLILFGNGDTNSWLDPLLEAYPFQLRTHQGDRPRSIVVGEPRPDEQSAYITEYPGVLKDRRLDYALISMLPGLEHDVRLLLINGLNHYATQAAVEYLTTPNDVTALLSYLRAASEQQEGPWFFQLVLRVEVREGVPTRSAPAALRIVDAREGKPRFDLAG